MIMVPITQHVTIRKGYALPEPLQCDQCCTMYHCPFCPDSQFKPCKLYKWKTHIRNHAKKAVTRGGFTIYRCGLDCRKGKHFHCPTCVKTILRRRDFVDHLPNCSLDTLGFRQIAIKGTETEATPQLSDPTPAAAVLIIPADCSGAVCTQPVTITSPVAASDTMKEPEVSGTEMPVHGDAIQKTMENVLGPPPAYGSCLKRNAEDPSTEPFCKIASVSTEVKQQITTPTTDTPQEGKMKKVPPSASSNGVTIFNGPATFHERAIFSGPTTFRGPATFWGPAIFHGTATFQGQPTFHVQPTFHKQRTFSRDPLGILLSDRPRH